MFYKWRSIPAHAEWIYCLLLKLPKLSSSYVSIIVVYSTYVEFHRFSMVSLGTRIMLSSGYIPEDERLS